MNSSQDHLPHDNFYITGGTLPLHAPSYVPRHADTQLLEGLQQRHFCYVLNTRQMGKSSLMIRTALRLQEQGCRVAILDLTAIGHNLSVDRWYFGLLGMAAPTDLIHDTRIGPFNIGKRIERSDFTSEEAEPLAQGLTGGDDDGHFGSSGKNGLSGRALRLLRRVQHWTGGHPYMTQRRWRRGWRRVPFRWARGGSMSRGSTLCAPCCF